MLLKRPLSSLLPPPKHTPEVMPNVLSKQQQGGEREGEGQYQDKPRRGIIFDHLQADIIPSVNFMDFIPIRSQKLDVSIQLPTQEQIDDAYHKTKQFIDSLLQRRTRPAGSLEGTRRNVEGNSVIQVFTGVSLTGDVGSSSQAVRVVQHVADPLQPSQFKTKKIVTPAADEPVQPILHESDVKLSKEERAMWEIPSAVSSWKNPNGYTVGLDKRVAMDGRYSDSRFKPHDISGGFVKLADALDQADKKTREQLKQKAEEKKQLAALESQRKEEQLRSLVEKARADRVKRRGVATREREAEDNSYQVREADRVEKRRNMEKEMRLSKMSTAEKLRALAHSQGRDVSEKVILGAAKSTDKPEVQYDSRMFIKGAASAAKHSESQIYDTPLFSQSAIHSGYIPTKFSKDVDELDKLVTKVTEDATFEGLLPKRAQNLSPEAKKDDQEELDPDAKRDHKRLKH